jgi:prevent-host-death family protein
LYIFDVQSEKGKKMQSVAVSELRANLLKILKRIEQGSSISITSRGRVVAKLIPPEESIKIAEEKLARIRKTAKIHDVLSPVSENWKADS